METVRYVSRQHVRAGRSALRTHPRPQLSRGTKGLNKLGRCAARPDSAAVPAMLVRSFPPLKARMMADTCRSTMYSWSGKYQDNYLSSNNERATLTDDDEEEENKARYVGDDVEEKISALQATPLYIVTWQNGNSQRVCYG